MRHIVAIKMHLGLKKSGMLFELKRIFLSPYLHRQSKETWWTISFKEHTGNTKLKRYFLTDNE